MPFLPSAVALAAVTLLAFPAMSADLRLGMIGLDTSHSTAFTDILHVTTAKDHVPGARVVVAFKGGSPDLESSWSRVEGYARTLREKHAVRIVDTIEEVCRDTDAVLIESVDGRPHLAQARPVIAAGKPLYIDKPMAGSLKDAVEIFRLARAAGVPVFSASSLRFARTTQAVRGGSVGTVTNAWTSSPAHLDRSHPDLFWYGIHGVESLFTVMGPGCEGVTRTRTGDGRIEVQGMWKGGRKGTFRESEAYAGHAQGTQGEADVGAFDGYAPLVSAILTFFRERTPPVDAAETLEILAFMEAADESVRRNGATVKISEMLDRAGLKPGERP